MSDLWRYSQVDKPLDNVLEKVLQLKTQLEVQKVFQENARLLKQQPMDQPLPRQQAVRVKHLMKFVFEQKSREKEKQEKLRRLTCDSLVFLGISYNVKTLYEMRIPEFDFVVHNIDKFIQQHNLNDYMYRKDIDRVINQQFEVDDDDDGRLLKEFLKQRIELRPLKRKFVDDRGPEPLGGDNTSLGSTVDGVQERQAEIPTMSIPSTDSLTGAVYQLTIKDAQAITMSDHIRGGIWLTNTYNMNFPPFVTIPISQEMSDRFATRCLQINFSSEPGV
ncbi:hypothetical protein BDV24DRAFT_170426 [Aspergillus arachidicola]|uniref:Uncharacterized protein n=1 Tax=Aspergillus arachidicola TaxID=656916 RepID=A0A5N6XLZ7_9EURO|nr:hypothetical protein BDV24DRAFT_170426 [Aspergillus arachidicola]